MGAVGGGEGIIHENIAEAAQDFCKGLVVLFFTGMVARVFHQGHGTGRGINDGW
jgi:hypothetical protein